jgi:hydroxymethylpyrimidine pyrophosphatase-like HAD family hydrolase
VGLLCGLQAAYAEKQDEKYDKVFKNFYTRVEYVDDLTAVEAAADKFTVYLPNDDSQKAFDRIYGAFHTGNGGAFSVAVAGRNWVDVMNPGVHKGAALAKVGALLGIPADSMMAFGDTYNDAEMLTTAKYGFLMENGSGPLRAQVPFLAPSHREYGVMQVLKQVLRQNGEVSSEDFTKAH